MYVYRYTKYIYKLTKHMNVRHLTQKEPQNKLEHWIKSVLSNDEDSTDQELVDWFMQEGGLSKEEAEAWVSKRSFYLNNLVRDDGMVFDPETRTFFDPEKHPGKVR